MMFAHRFLLAFYHVIYVWGYFNRIIYVFTVLSMFRESFQKFSGSFRKFSSLFRLSEYHLEYFEVDFGAGMNSILPVEC
jgi:hypothetical protein